MAGPDPHSPRRKGFDQEIALKIARALRKPGRNRRKHDEGTSPKRSSKINGGSKSHHAKVRGPHVDRRGATTARSGRRHAVGFDDRAALHQEQQPVEGPAADRRATSRPSARPLDRDGDRRPGGAQLVPDQPGQPRRCALEPVDRRDDRRGRAVRGAGDRRPGRPPRGPRRVGRGRRAGADRRAGSTRSTAGPAASRSGSTWRRPRGRGPAWATASSTSGDPRLGRRARAARASASTPATFSRRGIPSATAKSTMGRSAELDRAVGLGPGPGLAPQRQPPRARQPGRSPRGDRPRASGPGAVPPRRQRPAFRGRSR